MRFLNFFLMLQLKVQKGEQENSLFHLDVDYILEKQQEEKKLILDWAELEKSWWVMKKCHWINLES